MDKSSPGKKRILIVVDDDDARYAMNVRLRASGFETVYATDGVSAVKMARLTQPDLILLDLGLPAGDGFLVMERLRAFPDLACTPVIVVSARDPRVNETRALAMGALGFFEKPADNGELLDAARHAIELADARDASTSH
jgi:DNA-binding response OmpR family regulator